VDVLVVIQGTDTAGSAWVEQVRALGTPVLFVNQPVEHGDLGKLSHAAELLGATDREPGVGTFERMQPGAARIELPDDLDSQGAPAQGRWLVLSETWHLWGGWDVRAGGEPLTLRRADGVATALWLPGGTATVTASYEPAGMTLALLMGALGMAAAALLLAWPDRSVRSHPGKLSAPPPA
jgi:hypothetical protein